MTRHNLAAVYPLIVQLAVYSMHSDLFQQHESRQDGRTCYCIHHLSEMQNEEGLIAA